MLTIPQLWLLYTKLPTPQSKQAAAGATLRKEVVRLNREMTNTSAQDDFAKWAKLRRQHDKKKAEYDENGTDLPSNSFQEEVEPKLTSHLPPSPIPQILPHHLRPHRIRPPLARHLRRPLPPSILVLQASPLLDPARLGAVLRRVAALFPARARRQRERQHVVDRVRERHQDGERGAGCALDFEFW